MMSFKQDAKRRKKFERLRMSQNAAGIKVGSPDNLVCPLCWKGVAFEDLTLEHIIPKSLCGTRETLTCQNCNKSAGDDLDNHLTGYQRYSEAWNGFGSLKMTMDVNEHRLAVRMTRDPSKPSTDFQIIGKASSPAAIQAAQIEFKKGSVNEMNAKFSYGYNDRRRQLALLKAAYLATFHRFGYLFISRPGLQRIRQLVADRELNSPDLNGVCGEMNLPHEVYDKQILYLSAKFSEADFVWVVLKCRLLTTVYRFVMLPIDEQSDEIFTALAQHAKSHPNSVATLKPEQFTL
ncbi:MAG: HNH endonuclease [Planctomycetota bacterium]